MKKYFVMLLAASMCMCFAACGKGPDKEQSQPEIQTTERTETVQSEVQTAESAETVQLEIQTTESSDAVRTEKAEVVGKWHLDSEKNDLVSFEDSLFTGYGEWGASMDIQSDGKMDGFIGIESWYGTYTVEDEVIHADLTFDSGKSQQTKDFRIVTENDTTILEMDYKDMAIYWAFGAQEDPANGADGE
ncbi:MAG: hypothetical protein ACI4D7_04715 [Lachnospiraceae bacterium]